MGLARAEQSLDKAQGTKCPSHEPRLVHSMWNQRDHLGMGGSGMLQWDAGWYPENSARAQGSHSSFTSLSASQTEGTCSVPQPLMDISAPSRTTAPRRSPEGFTVQNVPCATGGSMLGQAGPYARGVAGMIPNIWGIPKERALEQSK